MEGQQQPGRGEEHHWYLDVTWQLIIDGLFDIDTVSKMVTPRRVIGIINGLILDHDNQRWNILEGRVLQAPEIQACICRTAGCFQFRCGLSLLSGLLSIQIQGRGATIHDTRRRFGLVLMQKIQRRGIRV